MPDDHFRSSGGHGEPPGTYDAPIPDAWHVIADAKGYDIVGRIKDRYHLLLKCRFCGGEQECKVFTLRTAQPLCRACQEAAYRGTAEEAGLTLLHRDRDNRHYAFYRAECGHTVRRQFELVGRAAAGTTQVRCETCLTARETSEAEAQGWTLLGRDPEKDPNYRLYEHACGHEQRIARANMHSGRCACSVCGDGWWAEPSWLYLMRLDLPGIGRVVKLGHSRDPELRMRFQLGLAPDGRHELIRTVAMPTGREALLAEKAMHARLRAELPEHVVPPEELSGLIRVVSEIYHALAEPRISSLLDDIEDRCTA